MLGLQPARAERLLLLVKDPLCFAFCLGCLSSVFVVSRQRLATRNICLRPANQIQHAVRVFIEKEAGSDPESDEHKHPGDSNAHPYICARQQPRKIRGISQQTAFKAELEEEAFF